MAIYSLKTAKWRSLLTMLGVVIGVTSVVTMVSISEGVKHQLVTQINQTNPNLITIKPGHISKDTHSSSTKINLQSAFGGATFNEADVDAVKKGAMGSDIVPFSLVNGIPNVDNQVFDSGFVIATSDNLANVLHLKLGYGQFFSDQDTVKDGAVIGPRVAEQLFHENIPIGQAFTIRGQSFRVRGVLNNSASSPLVPYSNYNDAVFIPQDAGKLINGGASNIYQIIVQSNTAKQQTVVASINHALQQAHAGQQDFTVLRGNESYATADKVLSLLTELVIGIAAISLIVGGVGIMNIMLVAVSERTREIGIRKAIGATNRQILLQFITEALLISVGGGVLGIVLSFLANYFLRIFTSLEPSISWPIIGIASGLAIIIGVVFGIAPAIKASRKDPIEALRAV